MSVKRFSDKLMDEAIKTGWLLMNKHMLFSLTIVLLFICNFLIANTIIPQFFPNSVFAYLIYNFIGILISVLIIKTSFMLFDNEKLRIQELLSFRNCFNIIIFYFLLTVILGIGFILLIIPAIIWGLRLLPAPYLMVDQELGPVEAIKRSWLITKNSAWNLFIVLLPLLVIGYLANYLLLKFSIFSFIGFIMIAVLFVVMPVWQFAMVVICRKLNEEPNLESENLPNSNEQLDLPLENL